MIHETQGAQISRKQDERNICYHENNLYIHWWATLMSHGKDETRVCGYIYVCMCIYIYIYMCVCICIYIYVCVCVCVCICIYIYIYIYICICVYIYECVCVCGCVYARNFLWLYDFQKSCVICVCIRQIGAYKGHLIFLLPGAGLILIFDKSK